VVIKIDFNNLKVNFKYQVISDYAGKCTIAYFINESLIGIFATTIDIWDRLIEKLSNNEN
jgi:hypothetical protein